MLSTLSAYDFGYISLVELIERLEFTFDSLEKLQKFRGHFFNWHDTRTLQPMSPHYVSVVDSGNLCGHLIALKQACLQLPDEELFSARVITGLQDTLDAVAGESSQLAASLQRTDAITIKQLRGEVQACADLLAEKLPASLTGWSELIDLLNEHAAVIDDIVAALAHEYGKEELADLRWLTGSFLHQVRAYRRDLHLLVPWAPASSVFTVAEIASSRWQVIAEKLERVPSLAHISETCDSVLIELAAWRAELEQPNSIEEEKTKMLAAVGQLTSAMEQAAEVSGTLLAETYEAVVSRQIEYGRERGVPWGISESAYSARDLQLNYQYGPFGVPGLGLKRGLIEDLVVSPYSTILASAVSPVQVMMNLHVLEREG